MPDVRMKIPYDSSPSSPVAVQSPRPNRPGLAAIRAAPPARLYVVADGRKPDPREAERGAQAQQIATAVD